jgi:hypothetical protein
MKRSYSFLRSFLLRRTINYYNCRQNKSDIALKEDVNQDGEAGKNKKKSRKTSMQ